MKARKDVSRKDSSNHQGQQRKAPIKGRGRKKETWEIEESRDQGVTRKGQNKRRKKRVMRNREARKRVKKRLNPKIQTRETIGEKQPHPPKDGRLT